MAIKVERDNPDPIRKVQKVVLTDEYGAQMILKHPLTQPGYDIAATEAAAIAQMEANAAAYKAAIDTPAQ